MLRWLSYLDEVNAELYQAKIRALQLRPGALGWTAGCLYHTEGFRGGGGGGGGNLEELQSRLQTAVNRAFASIHQIEEEREQIRSDRDLLEAQRETLESAKAELQEAQEEVSRLQAKLDGRGGVFGCCKKPATDTTQEFVPDIYHDPYRAN